MTATRLPNPGSKDARNLGCVCPVLDNHHGLGRNPSPGIPPEDRQFWISGNCPLHAPKEDDAC